MASAAGRVPRGIQSVEVGYRVLLAVQLGPGSVQLADVAKRAGLSSGAAHNYLVSLARTGLVEQESRGLYRLGPSAFALSLTSFQQLNGYAILRTEAMTLFDATGQSTGVSVWSQGGPVSVFIQRSETLAMHDFRPGLIPIMHSAVGKLFAAYLPTAVTLDLIETEILGSPVPKSAAKHFIEQARDSVRPLGYARFEHDTRGHLALSAPVWAMDDRIPFALSLVTAQKVGPKVEKRWIERLLDSAQRAGLLLSGTAVKGPRSEWR